MIKFKELRWGNAFSYGESNKISLNSSALTQLVGKNGNGKSSIALIIEEVLFNTNSKKIKKADILNRYTKNKSYWIELDFDKDSESYEIKTTRTNTSSTVKLLRNGVDISNHTATGTYKSIEYIVGFDHKTFSQIVYQSSVSSLEFLTATDTARKKFLIELLNLSVYTKASEHFKELASALSKKVDSTQTKVNTVKSWLSKYEGQDLSEKSESVEPVAPVAQQSEYTLLANELVNIESTNKKIVQNNKYIEIINSIVLESKAPQSPVTSQVINDLKIDLATKQKTLSQGKSLYSTVSGPIKKCVTCSQDIDNSTMFNMAKKFEVDREILESDITKLSITIDAYEKQNRVFSLYQNKIIEWEKYHALIDTEMTTVLLDRADLESRLDLLQKEIKSINANISKVKTANTLVREHNAKVSVISTQMAEMRAELKQYTTELVESVIELTNLQVLVKAFSTTGLVAYKIECLVKDLEALTNQYLNTLADGRFQLSFKIASSDKLNVVITDNGRDVDIIALSSGERARVNVATLLAIRKLMQALSNSRTNLLILDETVENLDAEGKEKLIEVLLEEENLNTFLISHGFQHPLLEKIQIVKEANISRIDNG